MLKIQSEEKKLSYQNQVININNPTTNVLQAVDEWNTIEPLPNYNTNEQVNENLTPQENTVQQITMVCYNFIFIFNTCILISI